ncbi:MAG: UvrABC system protein B [Candidatus Uhrbacteria bacterium GW2011_GWD2_52_7]|uniref:UvrABC system protein B n=1 Tax=Candidatus Uhrbacteria bacterium GW2011_GWD2_52_7 TaxID=1618989 RepID=A0A0G1XE20_9BACT|nr:MAG: UvrABC system protein B [Candidatus Uhrbacteria bacterium GW2011_GWD2_52_7]
MNFKLHSNYQPAGDQPKAIEQLTDGVNKGLQRQTLLGVTGSGKTFTMANVIQNVQKPTLVIAHNKTLAAQLCQEFREFFPENSVSYFVSYYDYYQPEAYLPRTDTYIEKDAQINQEIDRLRHAATQALLSRRDVIIVASVSCIYGLGSPKEYENVVIHLHLGDRMDRTEFMRRLISLQYQRTTADLQRGYFRGQGDVIEVMPPGEEMIYRVSLEGGVITNIMRLDPVTRRIHDDLKDAWFFPAKHFVTPVNERERALQDIERELQDRLKELDQEGKLLEYERLMRRSRYDIEMIRNLGYCSGIENYSRHFDGRRPGQPPYTLLDYFPNDFLTIIDESHVTLPQIAGMYAGDQARKQTLIDFGFRLPSARDNRPLQFDEFDRHVGQAVYVSATPGEYERKTSERVVEQIIRPTGLVDPETIVLPVTEQDLPSPLLSKEGKCGGVGGGHYPGQVTDLMERVKGRIADGERTLVTTLTKKMAEDLTEYLKEAGVKVAYLHSDVETLDRITILSDLRRGTYDVVVGVNLLREGLDLPEVSLIAILDADKEGFLRSETSLIQTIGRAARNINGQVVLYADKMTGSLDRALKETDRRRNIQIAYNVEHGITPKTIIKVIKDIRAELEHDRPEHIQDILKIEMTASAQEIEEVIAEKEVEMDKAAANLMFETAAILRDEIKMLKAELGGKVLKKKAAAKRGRGQKKG